MTDQKTTTGATAENGAKKVLVKGDLVTIYNDVITEAFREGKAILVRKIHGGQIQRWVVRFISRDGTLEDEAVERAIKVEL
jgi:hypothetical protein